METGKEQDITKCEYLKDAILNNTRVYSKTLTIEVYKQSIWCGPLRWMEQDRAWSVEGLHAIGKEAVDGPLFIQTQPCG